MSDNSSISEYEDEPEQTYEQNTLENAYDLELEFEQHYDDLYREIVAYPDLWDQFTENGNWFNEHAIRWEEIEATHDDPPTGPNIQMNDFIYNRASDEAVQLWNDWIKFKNKHRPPPPVCKAPGQCLPPPPPPPPPGAPGLVGSGAKKKRTVDEQRLLRGMQLNQYAVAQARGEAGLRPPRHGPDIHLTERELKQAQKVMLKHDRYATLQSAPVKKTAVNQWNERTLKERHAACGSRTNSIRFLVPGSRVLNSGTLPRCYDKRGHLVN